MVLARGAPRVSLLNPIKLRVTLRLLRGVQRNGVNYDRVVPVQLVHIP